MSYSMSDLILAVLPRVGRLDAAAGITIYSAATSVQDMIFKQLLRRRSDLLPTGYLFRVVPQYDYMVPLPSDFLSLAEKLRAVEATSWLGTTPWMVGTVTSYDSATKALVLEVTATNGSGSASSWHIAIGARPGEMIYTIDTSASALTVGTGSKSLATETALSLVAGQNVILSTVALPTDSTVRSPMQPSYMDEDDHEDYHWWERYRIYGETWESAAVRPRKFRVLGTNLYVRPKVSGPVIVTGWYNAIPAPLTGPTDTFPWNDLFYETFVEGVVRVLLNGVSIPEADVDIVALVNRNVETVVNSRIRMIPSTRRVKRSAYL